MSIIYRPRGRAAEYSHLAVNLYDGCVHGCTYCYVPGILHITPEEFHAAATPRRDILERLRKDAKKLAGTNERVLLCFTSDPYQPGAVETGVTRGALKILREFDIPFQILTKGGFAAAGDFDLYGSHDVFATTLTTLYKYKSVQWEPNAASPSDRMTAIVAANRRGIETWVSLEPVLSAPDSLEIIERFYEPVDHFKIGMLNHRKTDIDWRAFGIRAVELCERLGKPYYIKDDLARHLANIPFTNSDFRTAQRAASDDRKTDTATA